MASQGPHSGLVIEVPEAEPAVRHHREHLDANAPLGIPAHITVLFPFMPPEMIDPPALTRLRQLFAVWLAPEDPRPIRALTQRVFRAYPAFPPFDGQFGDVVPHLTIGHGHPLDDLHTAESSVQARLPIESSAAAVTLMTQQSAEGHWTRTATFPLR